jgi:hypothetical protein
MGQAILTDETTWQSMPVDGSQRQDFGRRLLTVRFANEPLVDWLQNQGDLPV